MPLYERLQNLEQSALDARPVRSVLRLLTRYAHDLNATALGYKMPSTSRDADVYRLMLYPDCQTTEEMLTLVRQGTLDIGSGLTHLNPYSLINEVAREKREELRMIGIDLRLGFPVGHEQGFSRRNILFERLGHVARDIERALTGETVKRGTPAKKAVTPVDANEMPFPDGSFYQVLSNFCYPYWFPDGALEKPFLEADRVTRAGGQLRFFPGGEETLARLQKHPAIAQALGERYGVSMQRADGWKAKFLTAGTPTLILTKKADYTSA